MDYIHEIGKRAKSVSAQVQHLSQNQKRRTSKSSGRTGKSEKLSYGRK